MAVTDYHRGPQPKINDLDKFKEFAQKKGHLTQKQMAEKWPEPVSSTRIDKALKKIDFTRKKTYTYKERDEEARKAFEDEIKQYGPERLTYMDQAGLDNSLDYPYGYCHKSEGFKATKLGHRTERVSIISWWWNGMTIAPMIFEGYCNAKVVCDWIEEMLLPELIPSQILIMDNVSFHPKKNKEIAGKS
nr:transposase [Synechocystis salina]